MQGKVVNRNLTRQSKTRAEPGWALVFGHPSSLQDGLIATRYPAQPPS